MTQVIYLSEVVAFFKKNKRRIFFAGFLSFCLTFLLVLFSAKPEYLAQASFRQSNAKPEEASSLQSILRSMRISSEEPPAISVMQSKKLLGKVVEECGLQIESVSFGKWGQLLKREFSKSSPKKSCAFSNVHLLGDEKEKFIIRPLFSDTFEVVYGNEKKIGYLGNLVQLERSCFTMYAMPEEEAAFRVISKREAASKLQKRLKIKPSRLDSNVLLLKCKHRNRETAIAELNLVMDHYQSYLREEHEYLASEQIRYLQKRRDELERDFDSALDSHVAYLQSSLEADGFLGLTQEVAMLSEPKEMYSGRRHDLDLQQKRWKEEELEASSDHPWKQGLSKQEELSWQARSYITQGLISEEFEGIDLETAEKFHAEYCRVRDEIHSQIEQLSAFIEKVSESEFEVSALSQVLLDEVSQGIVQKAAQSALKLADRRNYSEKECKRLEEMLETEKSFLCSHMEEQKKLLESKYSLAQAKIAGIKQTALALIEREKAGVDAKLQEIKAKMQNLPEKWRMESQLKLKKELNMQILEGLAQLSESKMINHHLFHVESKPLDWADAPLRIQPPHLFLFSSMGGILGAFCFFMGILLQGVARGFTVSEEYLRSMKYPLCRQDAVDKLALSIQNDHVVALIGYPNGQGLASALTALGFKVLHLVEENLNLHHRDFAEKLSSYKSDYDSILLDSKTANGLSNWADRIVLYIREEKAEDLDPFDPKKTICVLK